MLNEIRIPSMGATMEEGKIVVWRVKEGDRVKPGDVLLEIETDKSVFEVESPCGGVVRRILVPEGETKPVQTLIALVGDPTDDLPALTPAQASPRADPGAPVPPPTAEPRAAGPVNDVKISPRARKLAEQLGVDIRKVSGSGPEGRIESADIERAARTPPSQPLQAGVVPFDATRLQINRKVTQSKQEIPHFYLGTLIDATRLVACQGKARAQGRKMSVNAVLMQAIAKGLEAEPALNVTITANGYAPRASVDVGLAIETPRGVVIAVVENVNRLDAVALSDRIRSVVEHIRSEGLRAIKSSGACMTISNVGMYRADWFIPIIHPGETAILGVGSLAERAVVAQGTVVARPTLPLTLCVDHRIADGAVAARFLKVLADYVEKLDGD
jgi:pyruvate dehydrogenase E2 component (dihydrolipoamide acetyltransferase)